MMDRRVWWMFAIVCLMAAMGLMGCARLRVEPVAGALYSGSPVTVQELCQNPFGHARRKVDFTRQLPRTKVTRMVNRNQLEPERADSIFRYNLPGRGYVLLYQTSFGQELFMAASIAVKEYPLRNGLHVGIPLDSVRRYVDLPEVVGDTLKLAEPGCPFNLSLYFDANRHLHDIKVWNIVKK